MLHEHQEQDEKKNRQMDRITVYQNIVSKAPRQHKVSHMLMYIDLMSKLNSEF